MLHSAAPCLPTNARRPHDPLPLPGQYFSCDARNAEGDRRLCPLHEQAPTALRRILAALDEDVTPVELVDQIRLLAMRALGAGPP